jgi:hypothetical protein
MRVRTIPPRKATTGLLLLVSASQIVSAAPTLDVKPVEIKTNELATTIYAVPDGAYNGMFQVFHDRDLVWQRIVARRYYRVDVGSQRVLRYVPRFSVMWFAPACGGEVPKESSARRFDSDNGPFIVDLACPRPAAAIPA